MTHQITLEILDPDQHTGEETRAELARELSAEVGAPEAGLFDLRVEADSREEALQRVADVIAEMGLDHHFTFPSTTGTDYHPPGRRGVPGLHHAGVRAGLFAGGPRAARRCHRDRHLA